MPVTFDYVPANAKASGIFVEQKARRGSLGGLLIPHKIGLLGQYNAGKTPTDNVAQLLVDADDAATRYGLGSMLHIMAKAAFAGAGIVPVYAIPLADGAGTPATADCTVAVTTVTAGTISLYIAGRRVQVAVTAGQTADQIATAIRAAVNADTHLPVTATGATNHFILTARWDGTTGNGIRIQQDLADGESLLEPGGVTLTLASMASGTVDPVLTTALANLGDLWITELVSPYTDSTSLTAIDSAWTTRIDPGVKRPFIGLMASILSQSNFISLVSPRNSPSTTIVPVEDCPHAHYEIAAAAAGVAAARWTSTPGRPCRGLTLPGIRKGTTAPWTYAQRDAVITAGGSTTMPQTDGTVKIEDLATTYKTNSQGGADDSWRWTETIANIQEKIYSLEQLFMGEPFDAAVIVDDDSVTAQSYAVRPKTAKAFCIRLIDELWVPYALTKERDAVVAGIIAEINLSNPNRLDVLIPDVLAAGLKIIAGKIEWSFYAPVGA
jgi:phage tail sheath gpL-like